ncbi:MAG: lytic transglycosylase domain-containing protein [Alphaproteobacteria bacterium]|nr:lytic transglycosylase domain-containing protein [Alphaproteobacteria bacterium]
MKKLMVLGSVLYLTIGQAYSQSMNMCGSLIRRYEMAHGIPQNLLTAISLVESGRKMGGSHVAWPWTINANGKPYVFATKNEAIAKVRKLRQVGITSIDVGCMQVNLKQHPGAFPTLDAAFDPATNIAYAAKFLKAKKLNKGSWVNAVAHYHSSTAKFHAPYRARVLKTWAKVQNGKVSLASPMDSSFDMQSSLDTFQSNLAQHQGVIVHKVAAPSGRRVNMVVHFAPYKGFNGGMPGIPQSASEGRVSSGPKIIRGFGNRGALPPKVIVNTLGRTTGGAPRQFRVVGSDAPEKIIHVSVNRGNRVLPSKPQNIVIPKSPSTPQ